MHSCRSGAPERSQDDDRLWRPSAGVARRRKALVATILGTMIVVVIFCTALVLKIKSQALMVMKLAAVDEVTEVDIIQVVRAQARHAMTSEGGERGRGGIVPWDCDLFEGTWVSDSSYPLFNHSRCTTLDVGFDCLGNGRPDRGFLQLRWQPRDCHMPRFDPHDMLERLRNGGRVVFVGDSIGRNQWQSLLCMLGEAVPDPGSRIVEINNKPSTDHMGFFVHRFLDYNLTVEYYRSTWLVTPGQAPEGADAKLALHLDRMDENWAPHVKGADVVIFNSGHWWNGHKTHRKGYGFFVNNKLQRGMEIEVAQGIAMGELLRWVGGNIDETVTQVFFRTYAPAHQVYPNGKARKCYRDKVPQSDASYIGLAWPSPKLDMMDRVLRDASRGSVDAARVRLLNTTYLTALRSDGHSSIYNRPPPVHGEIDRKRCDCNHWCLPGVPDTWNSLLYARLLQLGQGRWASPLGYVQQ